jgi:hypothetical protein
MTLAFEGSDHAPEGLAASAMPDTGAEGARLLMREVLPLWRRHLEAARDEADRGVGALLQRFVSLGSELAEALAATGHLGTDCGATPSPCDPTQRLQQATQRLSNELDMVFAGFQFQDRLNQMLGTLQDDMDRLNEWLEEPRPATSSDVADWLASLEKTYTMEEQRVLHHGKPDVQSQQGIEFF